MYIIWKNQKSMRGKLELGVGNPRTPHSLYETLVGRTNGDSNSLQHLNNTPSLTEYIIVANCKRIVLTASCSSSTDPATTVLISNVHHSKHNMNSPGTLSLKNNPHSVRLSQLHPFHVCLCRPLPQTYAMRMTGAKM